MEQNMFSFGNTIDILGEMAWPGPTRHSTAVTLFDGLLLSLFR